MKLYRISQTVNGGYDTYDSIIVCANNKKEAKLIHKLDDEDSYFGSWVKSVKDLKVEYLGEAKRGIKAGEILSSFNAG